jgi:hypothetical protein
MAAFTGPKIVDRSLAQAVRGAEEGSHAGDRGVLVNYPQASSHEGGGISSLSWAVRGATASHDRSAGRGVGARAVRKVRCDDGRSYLVVMTPPPFLRGAGPGDVLRAVGGSLDSGEMTQTSSPSAISVSTLWKIVEQHLR